MNQYGNRNFYPSKQTRPPGHCCPFLIYIFIMSFIFCCIKQDEIAIHEWAFLQQIKILGKTGWYFGRTTAPSLQNYKRKLQGSTCTFSGETCKGTKLDKNEQCGKHKKTQILRIKIPKKTNNIGRNNNK